MKTKIVLPRKVLDIIKSQFQSRRCPVKPDTKIGIILTEKELRSLGKDTINFLEKYVKGVVSRIGGNLGNYLRGDEYGESERVVISIPFGELVENGILWKKKQGEFVYWVLQDEVLDPRTYKWLYLVSEDTTRTLMNELGYLEIYEKYKNRFKVVSNAIPSSFATILLDNGFELVLDLFKSKLYTNNFIEMSVGDEQLRAEGLGKVTVDFSYVLTNPSVKDIEKIKYHLDVIKLMVEENLMNILSYTKRELQTSVEFYESPEISVTIINHRLVRFRVTACLTLPGDRSKFINIYIELHRRTGRKPNQDTFLGLVSSVSVTRALKFRFTRFNIVNSFENYSYKDLIFDVFDVSHMFDFKKVGVTYGFEAERILIPPGLRKMFHTTTDRYIMMLLKNAVWEELENDMDKVLTTTSSERNITVEDFLKFLRWRDNQDLDETLLKLSITSLEFQEDIGLDEVIHTFVSRLMSLALFEGHDERKIVNAVENPRGTLLKLILDGKLQVKISDDDIKVKFKGKDLSEILSFYYYTPKYLEETLQALVSMVIPREKIEKIRKRIEGSNTARKLVLV